METGKKETRPRYGIARLERRRHRRFTVNLPIEYYRVDSPINQTGQAFNASEGGLQILFPEKIEVGQSLKLRLFFSSDSELTIIEMVVEVVWVNTPLGEDEKKFRSGVRIVDVSPQDMIKLKKLLESLSE